MDPFLAVTLFLIGVIIILAGVLAICLHIRRLNGTMTNMNTKLASLQNEDNKTGGTVLLPVTRMDPKAEINTVLPLPIGSEMCQHTMDIIVNQTIKAPHEERALVILQCTKCGAMDKTIAVTSPPPPHPPSPPLPPQPKSECRHQWVKEKTVNLDSAFEQMEGVLKQQFLGEKSTKPVTTTTYYRPNKKKAEVSKETAKEEEKKEPIFLDVASLPAWMFRKTSIRERICRICGEVDRVVSSNFDMKGEEEPDNEEMD